ncbi:MAG: DUF899 domain-containing protein [Paracoccaceae bacterium]
MQHRTATRADWLTERTALLAREKEFNTARDALSAARRDLPWVKVDKDYQFDTKDGPQSLSDLFGSHSQLIIYHFMFGTDWSDPCKSCSYWIDNFNGIAPHLAARDTALVMVSKGSLATLQKFAKRMGWILPWVSSANTDFNEDYDVTFSEEARKSDVTYNYRQTRMSMSDMPGTSVFAKGDDGHIYHTYSTYSRGLDMLNGAYHLLDITPKGRDEGDLPFSMGWLNYHDSY